MLEELLWAFENEKFYPSKHFTELGDKEYPRLLQEALAAGTPDTLEESLNVPVYWQPGSPSNAIQTFAWDEFNKYYMRALCQLKHEHPECDLVIARGRESVNPKPGSNRLLGKTENASRFLHRLRGAPKVNPFGANSGLTLELQERQDRKTSTRE